MKTSNYILLSFLIFLFGGITLLCFGSKYYKSIDDRADFVKQEKQLPPFSVVVAEPGAYLVLTNGREFSVSQAYKKEEAPDLAPLVVRNDTLFVSAVKSRIKGKWFVVPEIYCKNVKSIIAKENTNVNLKNYQVDSLSISLNKSDFSWDFNKPIFVNIEAENSNLHFDGDNIEKINLQLDKTKLYLNSQKGAKMLSGSIANDSYIDGVIVDGKINLGIDNSSRMYFRN